jgi:hypothetical protein
LTRPLISPAVPSSASGRRALARDLVEELNDVSRRTKFLLLPLLILGPGDKEQVFAWMERAYQEQSMILQFLKGITSSIPSAMTLALQTCSGASG